jgi:hypothetical protein
MRVPLVPVVAFLAIPALAAAVPNSRLWNLDKDLALYFRVKHEIRQTDPDPGDRLAELERKRARRLELFARYGIRDEKHWKKETDIGWEYANSERAAKIYGSEANVRDMEHAAAEGLTLEQYRVQRDRQEVANRKLVDEIRKINDPNAFDPSLLEPIEGVTLAKYAAAAAAALFYNDDWAAVTRETGVTEKTFERQTELWTERMRKDPTMILGQKYTGHLMAAARGRYAAAGRDLGESYLNGTPLKGPEPVTMEKWVEITEYYGSKAGEVKGPEDVTRILQPYGLTFYEWNIVSNWWGKKRTEAMEHGDRRFLAEWTRLMGAYRGRFGSER